ncbi:MAG TPA: peptidoglycan-associated lipoprotein Pal [Gemmatimonadales bacterium]
MRASSLLMLLATTAVAAGCGGKKPPEEPAPQPAPAPTPAPTPPPDASEDSVRIKREQEAQRLEQMRKAVAADLAAMINFDYDQALVRSADESTLDRKAAVLQANPNVKMTISGHADERGSDEYNLALGNRRAGAAKRYLQNKGVDGSRLDVVSYGEERPLNPGHDEAAYAQNRRDEFQVTAGGDQLVAPQ